MGFPLIMVYDIQDDGSDPNEREHNFGLLAQDYTDKPAMQAVRTLTSITGGRVLTGFISTQPTSLHALKLEGASGVVAALWSDAPGEQVTVHVPPAAMVVDCLGAAVDLKPVDGSTDLALTVREVDGPVFLFYPTYSVFLPQVLAGISSPTAA